jgi:DNA-binding PadR family transcriptional regulator
VISFLQPCLLVLLHQQGASHGYNLVSGLEQFGFNTMRIDPSLVYRSLREMEELGLVASEWSDDDSQGPQRRVYQTTEDGESFLVDWIQDLHTTRLEIDRLIAAYQKQPVNEE